MFARSLASRALISAFLFAPWAVGQISFYDITAGAFASPSVNPTLSGGGPYTGFTIAQVFASPGIKVSVRSDPTTGLVIVDNNGGHYYNVSTGAFWASLNPTMSGGPYTGQTIGQVFASGALMNVRGSAPQLVITNANGNHYYNDTTGAFSGSSNPALSGGPYTGKTIGQLFTAGVAIRVRAGVQPNLVIADAAGNHLYDDSTGAFSVSRNPTLTGGPFAGQTIGQAFIAGSFVDVRETVGSELSLTPRTLPPSTTSLSASPSGTATLSSPVTLTATVTPSSATGKVAFFDGAQVLGYATLASGQATFTTRLLASGAHQLRAMYTGNGSVAVSTSSPASYTITSVPIVGFLPVNTYPAGNSQRELVTADIDLDGDVDVIVVNLVNPGTVQVLRNNGNGTFVTAVPISVHANPVSVAVGDFNEDSAPDIVVSHTSGNEVGVILGNGNGTFQTPAYLAVDANALDVEVADFNGDGHADIGVVVSAGPPNEFSVFPGNGNGTFQAKRDTAGTSFASAVTGYFNSDNIVDVAIIPGSGGNVSVLLGDGTGGFNPAPGSPFSAAAPLRILNAGDINGDGNTDLTFLLGTPSVGIYLGSATGQFSSSGTLTLTGIPRTLTSGGDFDGDGRNDLVVGDFVARSVRVLTGIPSSPYFSAGTPISVAPTQPSVGSAVADLNGDGRADIVENDWPAAANGVAVLISYGPPASITPTAGTPQSVVPGGSFILAFKAVVRDSAGTPLPNISVTFTAPSSGASGTFSASATVVTDANGIATSPQFTANSTPGTYVVEASVTGVATPASFTLTNATPASIAVLSGSPQNRAITTSFSGMSVIVRDGAGNPLQGVTVTFVPPASGPSGTFSGATTVTTNVNGVTSLPSIFTANSIVGTYALQAFVAGVATPASFILTNNPAYIHYYASSTGSFSGSRGPLLTGGPMDGLYLSQVLGTGAQVDIRDAFASELYIFSTTGAHKYDLFGGTGYTNFNPTLSGGPYSGQTVGQVFSSGKILQARDTSGSNLVILDNSGAHLYDLTAGAFSSSNNPTLSSGGPAAYLGQTLGALVSSGAHISVKDNNPQVAITDASGIHLYQLTTGVFSSTQNPTLTGGAHAGMTVGQAFSAGLVLRVKDTPSTSLVLFDAPPAGPPATITAVDGTPQSTSAGTAFSAPFKAEVRDAANRIVPGVNVTFSAPVSGASCTFSGSTTVMTDLNGVATAPMCTANSTAGTYNATAAVSGAATPANFSLTNTAGAPASIAASSGTPQSTAVGTAFASPLVATVVDAGGNPVSGVTVTFAAPGSGASAVLSAGSAVTNASGQASITATANSTTGSYAVAASVSGVATPASFSLTNTVGAPASLAVVSGTPQITGSGTPFSAPLVVVVRDAGNNPLSAITVTFAAPNSGASAALSSSTVATNASGQASVTAAANGAMGSYSVTATVAGVSGSAVFNLTNTVGAATNILPVGGTPQSARINTAFATPLQLMVRDGSGNPVPGATVSFSAPGSGASAVLSATTAVTDAQGRASITATANNVTGNYDVLASIVGGATPATFHLTNVAGAPAEITSGDGGTSSACSGSSFGGSINSSQSAQVLTAFALPLSVTVRDAACNPVPGVSVTFTVPPSGPSATLSALTATTNAQGVASVNATANIAVGSYPVIASVTGVSAPAIFNLANIAGAPGTITPTNGSASTPQSTKIETSFTKPLTVTVKDAQDNPVSGATVTFSVPANGAAAVLSSATATTDAQGNASVTAIANSISGSYAITAYVASAAAPTSFQLTNTPGDPAAIASDGASACAGVGGPFSSTQSTRINTAFSLPLQVIVFDAKCNPVPGVTVNFTAPASGASVVFSAASAVTDANGVAKVVASANATAGNYQPSATVSGLTPALFNLTNTPGPPGSIVIKSGSPQTASVTTAFANPLVAVVKDSGGNLLSGVVVTFTAPAGAIQLSSTTATTNAQGEASIAATAGTIAGSYFVSASAPGVSTSAFFYLTATAGAAARLVPGGVGGTTDIPAPPNGPLSSPLALTVFDANGNPVSGVLVTFSVSGPCILSATSITTNAQGRIAMTGVAGATPGVCEITASVPGVAEPIRFRVTITSQVMLHAVTDAASFQLRAAPGGLMTIFGVNLADPASLPDGKQIVADKYPLPTTLGGVTLTVNGIVAPLLYLSPTQINFQLPQELELELKEVDGVKQMWVKVVVTHDGANTGEMMMRLTEAAPAIFSIAPDFRRAAAENVDLSVNTPENPVAPGSYIVMFATGQGPTEPKVPTGQPAPADKLAWSVKPVSATIAGRAVEVQYGGLAPGFAGLLQVNLHVPQDLAAGEHPVVITINGVASKPATIFVGSRPSRQP